MQAVQACRLIVRICFISLSVSFLLDVDQVECFRTGAGWLVVQIVCSNEINDSI